MIFRTRIGIAGLSDIGGRFYLRNATAGARVASALDEGLGWYSLDMGALPNAATADHIRWDSLGDATVEARENLFLYQQTVDLSPVLAQIALIKAKTDLITTGSVTVISPVAISGNAISMRAGDTWSIPITGLGDISDRTKLWFSVNKPGQDDTLAKLFIEETAGLTVLAAAPAGNASLASLTVNDEGAGDLTLSVDEIATKALNGLKTPGRTWTIKMLDNTSTARTLATGPIGISNYGVSAIA